MLSDYSYIEGEEKPPTVLQEPGDCLHTWNPHRYEESSSRQRTALEGEGRTADREKSDGTQAEGTRAAHEGTPHGQEAATSSSRAPRQGETNWDGAGSSETDDGRGQRDP